MNAIVVVDENWSIGKDGRLLVHLPGDLKYFKKRTLGKTVVVGRKTLESFPGSKPLPGRQNIVLTTQMDYAPEDCAVCHSKEELIDLIDDPESVFIAGGETIYRQFADQCTTFFVTKIYDKFDADRKFPNLDLNEQLQIVWESEVQEENGIRYQFIEYKRK